ncbi:cupin domain-containing protein [Variovorax ginsengisoli]|uniref:Cupin domain-containing protein n=1 Tax=Variovorax ginsengisoli TaxID=363844 RepID=A0ABT8SCP9_9BURK|nr:cupin domain-containing protein [Variovorax ginsengisoli]MDN8617400.1 cupin domain-containing protein [Variovorax ginsengisoli]MDO1536570.1 cupin domain-containing protein [Variovorax ginsengisoli]
MASDSSLNGNVPSDLNRIVTGQRQDGGGHVVMHSVPPRTDVFKHIPGMVSRLVWATPAAPTLPFDGEDPTVDVASFVPAPGETRLLVVTFPPDSVFAAADFNGQAAFEENLAISPGLAERFEPDGMHETPTVDYGILLDGELWLELDDAVQTHLEPFDIVVQNGTRHAWRNKSDRPATVAFVLIGARQAAK